jgi:hypothetical protein
VQFTAALSPPDVDRLRDEWSLSLDRYIPNLAYLERLTADTVNRLRGDFLVRACIDLDPTLKLAPWIRGAGAQPGDDASPVHDFYALLFDDAQPAAVESALTAAGAHDVQVFDDPDIGLPASVYFVLDDLDRLPQLTGIDEIMWIEPVLPITVTSVPAAMIQSGSALNTPIWDRGLHGEGQVIDVIDNGWPMINHCFFADSPPNAPGPNHRKVVHLRGTPLVVVPPGLPPAVQQPFRIHATFICGIAAGDDINNSGTHPDRGGAWAAKLTCGNENDLTAIPATPGQPARAPLRALTQELVTARADGAFIHSFSWRLSNPFEPLTGIYDRFARDVDAFTWQWDDQLVVCAAANSVGTPPFPHVNTSPGIAKNALCVAAAGLFGDHGSGVAGPSEDGRRKPDLMAVGAAVSSAFPDAVNTCAIGSSPQPQTSWATPHAAAAAALVRQYFTEGWYPVGRKVGAPLAFTPTGALLKAVLLNSTVDLTGVPGYPSDLEGWGVINLDRTLYFDGDVRKLAVWDVRHSVGLTPPLDARLHDLVVLDSAEQLKITLVWTEPAPDPRTLSGPGFAGVQLVNDLDLLVTAPDGKQYVGNDFTNGVSTPNGTSEDNVNNVEMVVVDKPVPGKWFIEVHGVVNQAHVPDPRIRKGKPGQGYALVASGALKPPPLDFDVF